MENVDCLFVHPSFETRNGSFYSVMPMGMFSMADLLERNNYRCRILNPGVNKKVYQDFSLEKWLKEYDPKVVAVDLHWYLHSYDALKVCKTVKNSCEARVLLGGFTASHFDEEIIGSYDFVDGVIRGDGEVPLLRFMEEIERETPDLESVPNLTYKINGHISKNDIGYIADSEALDDLDFTRLELLDNWKTYMEESRKSWTGFYSDVEEPIKNIFFVPTSRGCTNNCSYCSGSKISFKKRCGRENPSFRSAEKVVEGVEKLNKDYGVDCFYFKFDSPELSKKYYLEILEGMKKRKIDAAIHFGCCGLPDESVLNILEKMDAERVAIDINPVSASERVRKNNKECYYSNSSLLKILKESEQRGITSAVHFLAGLPYESEEDIRKTVSFSRKLIKNFGCTPKINTPSLEPGSPIFENPSEFNVKSYRKNFNDFLRHVSRLRGQREVKHPIGFDTEFLTEKEILSLKSELYRFFYLNPKFILYRMKQLGNDSNIFKQLKLFFRILSGKKIYENF